MKLVPFEVQRVLVPANQVRDQVLVRGAVVENLNVLGGLDKELRKPGRGKRGTKKNESRETTRDSISFPPTCCSIQILQCTEALPLSLLLVQIRD